jgi:hypothetical protein
MVVRGAGEEYLPGGYLSQVGKLKALNLCKMFLRSLFEERSWRKWA